MSNKTLYDKLWDSHLVREDEHGTGLIYIDRHLIHDLQGHFALRAQVEVLEELKRT